LWRAQPGMRLGDMARTDFALARPTDAMFDVIGRFGRRGARLAIVVDTQGVARVDHIKGYIGLETMGEGVIENARPYAQQASRNPFPTLYRGRVVNLPFWRSRSRS